MKIIEFAKQLVNEIKEDRAILEARRKEHEAWDRAGRPTGPDSDQDWRK